MLKCIPLLLAVRTNELYCQDENGGYLFQFDVRKYVSERHAPHEMYRHFMRETGLFDLLEHHIIHNLVDYVTGVETGLDSNARKNTHPSYADIIKYSEDIDGDLSRLKVKDFLEAMKSVAAESYRV